MATLTITSSNWDVGQIRITYTASNGTLKITEIEGKRSGGYRSWDTSDTSVTVSVGGTSKSISLSHYIDFGNNEWTSWGATDTSWTGLTGTSISVSTTMPTGTVAYSGAKFTSNATMSWSTYTIAYNANGGSGAPSSQTKTHGKSLTLSSTKPTRTGYTFEGWALSKANANDGKVSYQAGGTCGRNEDLTLYAVWTEHYLTINYYSNYATSAFDSALNTVSSDKNALVYTAEVYYDNDYSTYGLANYSNSSGSLYMTRTGYTATGDWGTSTSGGTLVNENTTFATGQKIAEALGKSLENSNASINVYAQWAENYLTINYHCNGADYCSFEGVEQDIPENDIVLTHNYYYDNAYSDGLYNIQNTSKLYLLRTGHTSTLCWGTSVNGGTLIDQYESYSTGQELAKALGKDISGGNASITIYAQWNVNTYTISYNGNGGSGSIPSQTVDWGEDFAIALNTFKKEGYKFAGYNVKRSSDNKWYVSGVKWTSESDIEANGYSKKLYAEGEDNHTMGTSWTDGTTETDTFTFYVVWELSGTVYIDSGTSFEPYIIYIDDGTNWNAYMPYVDNGTDWDAIS